MINSELVTNTIEMSFVNDVNALIRKIKGPVLYMAYSTTSIKGFNSHNFYPEYSFFVIWDDSLTKLNLNKS